MLLGVVTTVSFLSSIAIGFAVVVALGAYEESYARKTGHVDGMFRAITVGIVASFLLTILAPSTTSCCLIPYGNETLFSIVILRVVFGIVGGTLGVWLARHMQKGRRLNEAKRTK